MNSIEVEKLIADLKPLLRDLEHAFVSERGDNFNWSKYYALILSGCSIVNELEQAARESASDDELWRKLLWSNHARCLPFEHTPYGDDGEMQCCGIDFKRTSAQKIDRLLVERSLRYIQETKAHESAAPAAPADEEIINHICSNIAVRVKDDEGNLLPLTEKVAGIISNAKAGWREYEVLRQKAARSSEREALKEYKHFLVCNGDRHYPAGEPGHCCSCFNSVHQAEASERDAPAFAEMLSNCMDCGKEYRGDDWLDLTFSKADWLRIHPADGGVLCANCTIRRASKLPHVINVTGRITFADDYNEAPASRDAPPDVQGFDAWWEVNGKGQGILCRSFAREAWLAAPFIRLASRNAVRREALEEAVELLRLARNGMIEGPATEQAWRPIKKRIDKFLTGSPAGGAEQETK